jgi:hypothetical protein
LAAGFLDAVFVLTAAFFFAGAFFFDDERFAIARFFTGLRAGFFLAMSKVYQMFLLLRSNLPATRFSEMKFPALAQSAVRCVKRPHFFIFIIKNP